MNEFIFRAYDRARLDDRIVNELLGLSHGIIADGRVSQEEAEYLRSWLATNATLTNNPVIGCLLVRTEEYLKDGILDEDEAADLLQSLRDFTGGKSEIDGLQKSASLPLDSPPPHVQFPRSAFCFTGTFAWGSRKNCEGAVAELGGTAGSLTRKTDYLVIGIYATGSWAHSSYGRKIEKALELREIGASIQIIGEEHWASFLPK